MRQDPFVTAARDIIGDSLAELRRCLDGISTEGLNWLPGGEETNSLAILAVHAVSSTRDWLCVALGLPQPPRNRASEFLTNADNAASLLALVDSAANDCLRVLDEAGPLNWAESRVQDSDDGPVSAAYALVHAVEHLREHLGQMLLTRQLWDLQTSI